MAVRVCFRVPRQLQFRHDSSNHVLVSENAAVGEERESPGLCVVHDATAWELFVFRFSGNLAAQPPLFPNVDVAPRIGQEIAVVLGCSQRRAVDKRLAINEPKDTHSRLSRPCGCLALSAFMRFLHWLMFAADRSDVGGIFRAGELSQSSCNLPLYFVISPDAEVIAFAAFFNSLSTRSRSANVRRTSSESATFLSKKSEPCTRIRSNRGLSTSRSRGSHWRVVRSIHTPSFCPQRVSLSTCRSWHSSLATMTPTGTFRSLASRTSLSRSLSATTVLSLLSTSIFGCAGAPLGSRYAKMKSPFFGSFSLTEMLAHVRASSAKLTSSSLPTRAILAISVSNS